MGGKGIGGYRHFVRSHIMPQDHLRHMFHQSRLHPMPQPRTMLSYMLLLLHRSNLDSSAHESNDRQKACRLEGNNRYRNWLPRGLHYNPANPRYPEIQHHPSESMNRRNIQTKHGSWSCRSRNFSVREYIMCFLLLYKSVHLHKAVTNLQGLHSARVQ